jgi:hypothetical protein
MRSECLDLWNPLDVWIHDADLIASNLLEKKPRDTQRESKWKRPKPPRRSSCSLIANERDEGVVAERVTCSYKLYS